MPQPTAEQLLAARPCGAAVAALFSSGSEPALLLRRPVARPAPPLSDVVRQAWSRLGLALMRHIPCEDITFADQPLRRSRQM